LVVGSGYSAATTACSLATLAEQRPETWVIWLTRGTTSLPIKRVPNDPLRERDRLAVRANNLASRADANVQFFTQSAVESVEAQAQGGGFKVGGRGAGAARTGAVDRLIGHGGHTPDTGPVRDVAGPRGCASRV